MKKVTLVLTIGSLAFAAQGCGGLDEREESLFERGRAAAEARDWARAADCFTQVLATQPGYVPAYFHRGQALFELGRFKESLEDFTKAETSGELTEEEAFTAVLYRGRAFVEQGRALVPDTEFRSQSVQSETRKKAQDCFVKANMAFLDALRRDSTSYDSNLWRGYVLFRLENYGKAQDVFDACERMDPARWEHRFYRALAWEGVYKANAQSLDACFALVAGVPQPEKTAVYEHLSVLYDEVEPKVGRRIRESVHTFGQAFPGRSRRIDTFLAETRAKEDEARRQAKLKRVAEQVSDLVEREKFDAAVSAIDAYLKEEGETPEAARILKETKESWSLLLEARTEGLASSPEREKLETAKKNYELARALTSKADRLVQLQQKLNRLQADLDRREAAQRIDRCLALVKAGKHAEALADVSAIGLDGLGERERDMYHHIRGVASYSLGQYASAAKAFGAMGQRNFEGSDLLYGLSLVKSGQEAAGVPILVNTPPERRTDEVNRVLGRHFLERRELSRAVGPLSSVKEPTPEDLQALFQGRKELGLDLYRRGDFTAAARELAEARQIAEVQLHRRAVEVTVALGGSYYRLDDFERAKKTYESLRAIELTAAEREASREMFLFRSQIHLRDKSPEQAYKDLAEFVSLGGSLPPDLANTYGRMQATYADFMPLDKVQYWNYVSTARDYNYSLFVKDEANGERKVERKEAGNVTEEVWSREGIYLSKRIGETLVKLPVNLKPSEDSLPYLEYVSQGQECTAEVVAIGQTVETPGGKKYTDCLKVRLRRAQKLADGKTRFTKYIYFFAPNVGEVKQEVYRDDAKVSEIVLSDFDYKAPDIGN